MASNTTWVVEPPPAWTVEPPDEPSAFTKHLTQLGEDLVAAPKRLDESLTRITAPKNVERFIASLPKMDPKMEKYIDMEAYMGRPETIRKIAGLVQAGVAPGTLPEKTGRVMEESFRSSVPEGLVRAVTTTPEGVTAFINRLPPSTAESSISNAERSEAEMASGLTPALARIGAGTYNAAVGLGAAMASPGGVATVAAPIVAGLPVAAKFGYDAIQRLPEMGRRIADYIEPPPQPTDYQKPGMPYPDVPDTGKPEHLEDLTTEALGDMFMAIAPVLGAAHAGSKLKEWKETRKASEEQQFRAASDSVANMQREDIRATREVPGAPGAIGSPEMEFTVEPPEAGPAAAQPKPPTGPTDAEYSAARKAADAPLDLDKALAEGQKAAKEAEQNVAAQAEAAKAEARAKEMVDQEAFEAGREEVKRLQQEALEAAAIKEAQAEAARVAAIRDAQYTERVALDKADEAVAEVEIPAPGRVEVEPQVAAPTTPIPTLNEVAALETAYRTAADKLWAMKNGKAGRVSAAGIEANAVAVEAAKQRWQEANDLYRANRTPPKPQVTAPPDNPFIAKSKPAKAKPEPIKVSPHEALQDRIMELETDPETTKGAVMKVARKAAKDGLIEPRDLAEYERIAKDRDMGPEDITSLFRDDVEAARRKAATAPAVAKAEAWADKVLAERKKNPRAMAGGVDPEWAAAATVKGAFMAARKAQDFARWSDDMVAQHGREIIPHLDRIWTEIQQRGAAAIIADAGATVGGAEARKEAFKQMPLSEVVNYAPEADRPVIRDGIKRISTVAKENPEALRLDVVRGKDGLPKTEAVLNKDGRPVIDEATGKPKRSVVYAEEPYELRKAPGLSKDDAVAVKQGADRLEEFARKALKNPEIAAGNGWYQRMRLFLQKEFGATIEIFGQLLGATSARTPVSDNFKQALEALQKFSRGEYDAVIQRYHEHVTRIKADAESGELQRRWQQEHPDLPPSKFSLQEQVRREINQYATKEEAQLKALSKQRPITDADQKAILGGHLPLKEGGARYNMNTVKVLQALYGNWLEMTKGPKTPNFSGNLTGRTLAATIDVWAARNLRRLLYEGQRTRWRLLPEQETGVDYTLKNGVYGGDFDFAQRVYQEAANRLKMSPDDLQAIIWFAEKDHWEKKGWSSRADAEKSSFDSEASKLDLSRYQGGVTTFSTPEKFSLKVHEEAGRDLHRAIREVPGTVASRVNVTEGLYGDTVEPSFDVEFSTGRESDVRSVVEKVIEIGRKFDQSDVFVSKVVGMDHPNARPGVEVGFKRAATKAELDAVMAAFRKEGVDGFTIARDSHGRAIGIRAQYVPEISGRYDPVHLEFSKFPENAATWSRQARDAIRNLTSDNISYANETYFSTHVFGRAEYSRGAPEVLFRGDARTELGRRQRALLAESEKPVSGGNGAVEAKPEGLGDVRRDAAGEATATVSGRDNFAALDRVGKAQGRMASEQGGVAKELLQPMAGGIGGFLWGYSQNKDEPREVRVARAFGYGLLGVAIGSPALRAAVVKGVYNAKIPIGKLSKRAAANHFNNFVLFAQSVLGEMYNVIRSESALTASLAEKATRALGELEKQRDKAHPGDWYAMNQYLFNRGNPAFIADLKLRSHAITVRSTIDDLTLDLIGRGYAAPGSDLEMTMMLNLGAYLNRSYEIFTNPEFKFDPKNYSNFVTEYVKQALLSRSTKPIAELQTEAKDMAAHILAKGKGVVLAPNAVSFAQGKGIARTDGTMLMPRKELSDATAKLMGRIDDPLRAATITMDRMTRFVAASITQSQMAEIGLKTGLFTKHSTGGTSLPLSHYMPEIDHALAGHGPLAGLYAEPHVADALKTMQSYSINSWPLRALATTTGLMKISKTVLHPISWAPNLFTSIAQIVTQGSAARVLMHPSDAGMALRVVFDDVLPSSSAKVQADVPFLIRERILRQNVNLNDLVETAKASALSGLPGKRAITWVPDKVKGAVKATYKGALNGYGKMEEFPRVIGFYAEVDRYASALYNKKPSQLTTAEQAKVYDRAARVVRENYPNSSEIPDPIKKLSLAGILDPFVAFKYEVMFRTPYNTVKRAMSDIQEGRATGNNRLIAAGVNRLSWMVGTVGGVMAINAAFNATKGLKGEQDEAARRIQPIWDRTGSQIVLDLTPNEMAYANTSYLFPQALPGSAITAALAGKSAPEASVIFMQEAFGSMLGDGGLLLGSAVEAIGGTNAYGNRIYTRDAGAFVDISKIENRPIQDASLHAQQFAERLIHAFRNIVPGFWSEAVKWKKAAADEVGPDGQLYKTEDLARRLGGIRINRLDLPLQYERKAGELSSRLREAATNFTKARERKDATPQSINAAYEIEEQSRKRVWNDVSQYLKDGVILQQSADKMIQNLRDAGLSSEFILSASYGFYIPGKKDKEMSVREQFQALMAMDAAKQDATWAALVKADPLTAKAMRPMIHEVAQGRTQEEKLILSLDADDGSRARMIARIVLMQPSPEAKEVKFNELVNRGLTKGMTHAQLKGPGSEKTWAEARATLGKP